MSTLLTVCCLAATAAVADDPARLPDPTQPPRVHEAARERLQVTERESFAVSAIRIRGADRSALVNGRLVRVGAAIGEGRVVEIAADAVVIDYLGERNRVPLLPRTVRRPAGEVAAR